MLCSAFFSCYLWLFGSNFSFAYMQATSSFPFPLLPPLAVADSPAGTLSRVFPSDDTVCWKMLEHLVLNFPASSCSREVTKRAQ